MNESFTILFLIYLLQAFTSSNSQEHYTISHSLRYRDHEVNVF